MDHGGCAGALFSPLRSPCGYGHYTSNASEIKGESGTSSRSWSLPPGKMAGELWLTAVLFLTIPSLIRVEDTERSTFSSKLYGMSGVAGPVAVQIFSICRLNARYVLPHERVRRHQP